MFYWVVIEISILGIFEKSAVVVVPNFYQAISELLSVTLQLPIGIVRSEHVQKRNKSCSHRHKWLTDAASIKQSDITLYFS
jgi:actin-like ATPase involved in cell morphogenesis